VPGNFQTCWGASGVAKVQEGVNRTLACIEEGHFQANTKFSRPESDAR
jgi:hypothetical protein